MAEKEEYHELAAGTCSMKKGKRVTIKDDKGNLCVDIVLDDDAIISYSESPDNKPPGGG